MKTFIWMAIVMLFVISAALTLENSLALAEQTTPPKEEKSLDEKLLQDLDRKLLEDAPEAASKPPIDPSTENKDVDQLLEKIGKNMRSSETLIPEPGSSQKTMDVQRQIVDDLARLIKEEERRRLNTKSAKLRKSPSSSGSQQASQGSQGSQPGESEKPSQDSSQRLEKKSTRRADLGAAKQWMKEAWGALPGADREQMLQAPPEEFLPKYELLIENYYKRLSNEQKKSH